MCECNGLPTNCGVCQEREDVQAKDDAPEYTQSEYGPERYVAEGVVEVVGAILGGIVTGILE
jgi:hypothetical protein